MRTIKRLYENIVYIQRDNLYEEKILQEIFPMCKEDHKYNRILETGSIPLRY